MNLPVAEIPTDDEVQLGELTASLGFLLRLAQVHTFDTFYEILAPLGLKPGEFTVLWIIGLNPGQRQGTIARVLKIKPAHMTKLIRRVVDAGYVTRTIPEDDRRSVRLTLTARGRRFVDTHKAAFLNFHRTERAALTDGEYREFLGLLRKFIGIGEVR